MARDAQVTIRITSEELEQFQVLADKYGTTRQKLLYSVLSTGLETLQQLDSVGILKASFYAHLATDYVTDFVNPPRKKKPKPSIS